MDNVFREATILVNGENTILKKKNVEDIFKFNDLPYICVGKSGGGKTTLCLDIIHKLGEESSKIYYISATQAAIGEGAISGLSKLFRREPDFESILNVWDEIVKTCENSNADASELLKLISRLYPQEENKAINTSFKAYSEKLRNELISKYKSERVTDVMEKVQHDIEAWSVETLCRVILNGIDIYGSDALTTKDISVVGTLVSSEQKTLLFIDDVTSELENMKTSNRKVMFKGETISVSKAYRGLLIDILTRARRYNVVVCLFVHGWDTIDVKSKCDNFVVMDKTAASNLNMMRSVNEDVRKYINAASDAVFGRYPYHFIVSKKGGAEVCVSKADLHIGEELKLDSLNMKLLDAYESVVNNMEESEDLDSFV